MTARAGTGEAVGLERRARHAHRCARRVVEQRVAELVAATFARCASRG